MIGESMTTIGQLEMFFTVRGWEARILFFSNARRLVIKTAKENIRECENYLIHALPVGTRLEIQKLTWWDIFRLRESGIKTEFKYDWKHEWAVSTRKAREGILQEFFYVSFVLLLIFGLYLFVFSLEWKGLETLLKPLTEQKENER